MKAKLTVICIAALWLRARLLQLNFFHDEVYSAQAIKGIMGSGVPEMPSGLIYARAFPLSYISSLFTNLFGFSETTVRLFPLIIGLVSIVIVFLILKRLTTQNIALVAATILALSPWHIMYSVFARSFMLQALLFLLILYFLHEFVVSSKQKYLLWATISILVLTTISSVVVLIAPVIAYVIYYQRARLRKDVLYYLFVFFSMSVAYFMPSAIVPFAREGANPYSIAESSNIILRNKFFWTTMTRFIPLSTLLLIASTLYYYIRKNHIFIFPFFIVSSFLILSFINPFGNLQPRYVANFMLVYYLTCFVFIFDLVRTVVKKRTYILLAIIALSFVVSDLYLFPKVYALDYGKPTPRTLQISRSWETFQDIKSPVEYVNQTAQENDIVISLQPRGQTHIYLDRRVDYYLRTQSYEAEGHIENGQLVDDYYGTPMITSADELQEIILTADQNIWIISSKSELPVLQHIDKSTETILHQYSDVVYEGRDLYSKVHRIPPRYTPQ